MDNLISRRQTLQMLASSAVFGGLAVTSGLALIGCGGSGGDGGGKGTAIKTVTTRVPVSLPSGLTLPVAELEGGTAFGSGPIDATGFQAKVVPDAPTFAYIRHKPTGKFVMFGLVGGARPGITPLASAALSVALAVGIAGLAPQNVAQAMGLLEANTQVKALGDTIASALKTDPYALTGNNPTIAAALKAAVLSITGSGQAMNKSRAVANPQSRAKDPIVLVEPSGEQGGASVEQGSDSDQVVPTNHKRRPVSAYTFLVGHTPGAGASDTSAAKPIDKQDLEATTSIVGSIGSLATLAPFAPVKGKAVDLPVSGQDEKTHYETVVLMASGDNGGEPAFFSEPRYAAELVAWRKKRGDLNVHALLGGILHDLFNAAFGGLGTHLLLAEALTIAGEIETTIAGAGATVLAVARAGDFGSAAVKVLEGLTEDTVLSLKYREVIFELLGYARFYGAEAAAGLQGVAILGIAYAALAAVTAAGTLSAVADIGATYYDVISSPLGERWTETVLNPGVRISPRTAEVQQGSRFPLTADITGAPDGDYTFTWTLGGGIGVTLTGGGTSGMTVTTATGAVELVTTGSTQGTLKVTVEAKEKVSGKSLGKDVATLTVVEQKQPIVTPAAFTVKSFPFGENSVEVVALVLVTPVPGAVRYSVEGTGGHDPYYYQDHISTGGAAPLLYEGTYVGGGVTVGRTENAIGLAGVSTHSDDAANQSAYLHGRFDAFKFVATAYFQ